MTPRFAALRHPLFLCALAVLVVNDHVLKGARVLPGAVTGKLSDFAGLLVAPVLVAAVFSARTPLRRGLAFGAVALPFAAIKLSATAASWLVAAAAMVGLKFRIWQDATDLAAFVMLVPAWRLSAGAATATLRAARALPRSVWLAERAVLGASAAACVATSVPNTGYNTTAYIANFGPSAVDVRVRWVDAKLDCPAVMAGDPTRMLGPNTFNLGITYHLEAGATAPLDRVAAYQAVGQDPGADMPADGTTATGGSCDVALVETDQIPPTMIWWHDLTAVAVPATTLDKKTFFSDKALIPGQVMIVGPGLATPGSVKQGLLQKTVPAGSCPGVSQQSFQWSVPADLAYSPAYLVDVQELPDGCMELSLDYFAPGGDGGAGGVAGSGGTGGMGGMGGMGGAGGTGAGGSGGQPASSGKTAYLCIPAEDFPFTKGTQLSFDIQDVSLTIREVVGTKTLEVHQRTPQFQTGGLIVSTAPGDCTGDRLACGGYVMPAQLVATTGGQIKNLNPGESLSGQGFFLRVGRVEYVPVARDLCDAGYQVPSTSADFLISYE